jgi:MFS family permease
MNAEHNFIGRRFGLQWVLLTIAGWIIGFPGSFFFVAFMGWLIGVSEGSDSIILKLGLDNAAGFIFIVAVVSLMQWFALRRVLRRASFWVLSSIIGFTVSSGVHGVVCYVWGYPDNLDHFLGTAVWAMAFVVGGTLAGVLQQRILRRQVCHSAWWVPASAVGWGLSIIGIGLIVFTVHFHKYHEAGLFVALIGLMLPVGVGAILLGTVTGGTLIWLLRQPVQQTSLKRIS